MHRFPGVFVNVHAQGDEFGKEFAVACVEKGAIVLVCSNGLGRHRLSTLTQDVCVHIY